MIFLGEQIAEWKCHRSPLCVLSLIMFFLSQQGLLQKKLWFPWFPLVLDFIQWINKQKVTS